MGDEQQSLARQLAENEGFRAALGEATTVDDVVRIAGEHGLEISVESLTASEDGALTDAELESVSGGTMLHPTMSVFCGTNGSFCTFNPYACQSPG